MGAIREAVRQIDPNLPLMNVSTQVDEMVVVFVGVAVGVVTALAAGRLVAALLFGLAPTDLPTMISAVGVLVLVSAVAGFLPARRAALVDPLVALRYE